MPNPAITSNAIIKLLRRIEGSAELPIKEAENLPEGRIIDITKASGFKKPPGGVITPEGRQPSIDFDALRRLPEDQQEYLLRLTDANLREGVIPPQSPLVTGRQEVIDLLTGNKRVAQSADEIERSNQLYRVAPEDPVSGSVFKQDDFAYEREALPYGSLDEAFSGEDAFRMLLAREEARGLGRAQARNTLNDFQLIDELSRARVGGDLTRSFTSGEVPVGNVMAIKKPLESIMREQASRFTPSSVVEQLAKRGAIVPNRLARLGQSIRARSEMVPESSQPTELVQHMRALEEARGGKLAGPTTRSTIQDRPVFPESAGDVSARTLGDVLSGKVSRTGAVSDPGDLLKADLDPDIKRLLDAGAFDVESDPRYLQALEEMQEAKELLGLVMTGKMAVNPATKASDIAAVRKQVAATKKQFNDVIVEIMEEHGVLNRPGIGHNRGPGL